MLCFGRLTTVKYFNLQWSTILPIVSARLNVAFPLRRKEEKEKGEKEKEKEKEAEGKEQEQEKDEEQKQSSH